MSINIYLAYVYPFDLNKLISIYEWVHYLVFSISRSTVYKDFRQPTDTIYFKMARGVDRV